MTTELYKVHRPKQLKDVRGQDAAIKPIKVWLKKDNVPHTILFTGPSGCGKTTLARILAKKLKCSKHDFIEKNCAKFRGIDMVRDLGKTVGLMPVKGKCRVWVIDECHKMTNDAMNSFLKLLEDTPKHVYFMLCTTDPQKLLKAIRTRCTKIAVNHLNATDMKSLITETCEKEKVKLSKVVIDKIVEHSDGAARTAMVFLHQIIHLENEKDMLAVIQPYEITEDGFTLVKALLYKNLKWPQMCAIIKKVDLKQPEGLRACLLTMAMKMLISGKNAGRAYLVIDAFRDNFFDSNAPGFDTSEVLFVAACYVVINGE